MGRQLDDEFVRRGGPGGLLDLVLRGVRIPERDVGRYRVREEEALLIHDAVMWLRIKARPPARPHSPAWLPPRMNSSCNRA